MKPIKITDVKVYIVAKKPEGNFADSTRAIGECGYLIVDIFTDSGIHGIGLTFHEVGTDAMRGFILGTLKPLIMGMDPFQNEVIYEKIFHYFRCVGRKGFAFCALSAVDIALWDIKGKAVDLPLFRLLGGTQKKLPIYSSAGWTSYTIKELCDEMTGMAQEGYTMVKMKVGIDGGNNIREDLKRVAAVRKALGPDIKIALDANNAYKAGTAIHFASRVAEYDIEFFEEPVFADDIPGLAYCRSSTSIPVASGEHEYTRFGVRDLLAAGGCDIMQADIARAGGYTEMLKIVALSQAYNVWFAPHCMELTHMHLAAAAHNTLTLESLTIFKPVTADTFIDPPTPKNGFLEVPEKPGLGLELNMDYINKYGI